MSKEEIITLIEIISQNSFTNNGKVCFSEQGIKDEIEDKFNIVLSNKDFKVIDKSYYQMFNKEL